MTHRHERVVNELYKNFEKLTSMVKHKITVQISVDKFCFPDLTKVINKHKIWRKKLSCKITTIKQNMEIWKFGNWEKAQTSTSINKFAIDIYGMSWEQDFLKKLCPTNLVHNSILCE